MCKDAWEIGQRDSTLDSQGELENSVSYSPEKTEFTLTEKKRGGERGGRRREKECNILCTDFTKFAEGFPTCQQPAGTNRHQEFKKLQYFCPLTRDRQGAFLNTRNSTLKQRTQRRDALLGQLGRDHWIGDSLYVYSLFSCTYM